MTSLLPDRLRARGRCAAAADWLLPPLEDTGHHTPAPRCATAKFQGPPEHPERENVVGSLTHLGLLASGVITLNEELDRYKLIAPENCVAWPTGTGHALRDWLRSQGIEPTMRELPGRVR